MQLVDGDTRSPSMHGVESITGVEHGVHHGSHLVHHRTGGGSLGGVMHAEHHTVRTPYSWMQYITLELTVPIYEVILTMPILVIDHTDA